MKKLIMIGGPTGAGKSTLAHALTLKLPNSAILNGDWLWQLSPLTVNYENKKMILTNIQFILNSFINNSQIDHIIFYWLLDEQKTINDITADLNLKDVKIIPISLLPSMKNLIVDKEPTEIQATLDHLLKFQGLSTIKYDSSDKSAENIADEIIEQL